MGTPFASLSFQARLTLVAATVVAVTIAIAAVVIYLVARHVVYDQLDDSLRQRVENTHVTFSEELTGVTRGGVLIGHAVVTIEPPAELGATSYAQAVSSDGTQTRIPKDSAVNLPVTKDDLAVASGKRGDYFRYDRVHQTRVRMYTRWIAPELALQVARPLDAVDNILNLLQLILTLVAAGGVALSALLGWLIARAGLLPIYRLRAAVDHVTLTGDMSQRVPDEGDDELGLLGAHFNRMLGGLDQSLRTQRQLVADASHELRTPLASLRTNVEVLQRAPELPPPERQKLLKDVVSQIEQLTHLIGDLIDLARGDQTPEEKEEVRLDWIVAEAVERAATHWPAVHFDAELTESVVLGQARRLDRAVSNLLDNAGKWSPTGGRVEVRVNDHELTVRDHGPGIDPADLPYVFDRFWRAPDARGMPGSGLGLAIVRQVAEAHDATVRAELPRDGGTLMRLQFSVS
ncbi:MAG TPA: HAMP domain-containing sensor histidine kinase [Candidatus Dormibacteraeota bacterium]|nr:HAMP domain-containing sensor histidine kinase [Candidatus Dormibacteraeota bacterium]